MSANTAFETAKIYQFPKRPASAGLSTRDPAEVVENIFDMKIMAIEESLGFIVPTLIETLVQAGYSLNNDRATSLLVALLRGIMCEHFQLPHPLMAHIREHADIFDTIISDQLDLQDLTDSEYDDFE